MRNPSRHPGGQILTGLDIQETRYAGNQVLRVVEGEEPHQTPSGPSVQVICYPGDQILRMLEDEEPNQTYR